MANYQFTFRGLTFGSGTSIDLVKIDGLDMPNVSLGDVPRPQAHGDFIGGMFIRGRKVVIHLEGKATDASGLETLWNQLEEAFTPKESTIDQVEESLTYQLPGQTARVIFCRPTRRNMTIDEDWQLGIITCIVELKASDPRIYDDNLQAANTSLASLSGAGMTFNATFPLSFGGALTGGQMILSNTGKFPVPVVFTISGGTVDNPRIEHVGLGKALDMTGSLTASDTLLVDTKFQAIILNGTASRSSWLKRPQSEWFSILPGNNTIKFSGTSVGTATLSAAWRSGRV